MSHDHPSCSIPSYIDRHTKTELSGLTAEYAVFLALDEDADDTGVAVLSGDSTRDLLGGVNGFGGLDTEVFSQEGDAFWSPLNLPEVLRLERGNLLPAFTFLKEGSHFLQDVTRETDSDREFLFLHRGIRNAYAGGCQAVSLQIKKSCRDLNPDKEYQKLLCYHYTTRLNSTLQESNLDDPLRRRVFYPLN